jgi:hypothetical protein
MSNRGLAVIHCEPGVPWQPKRAAFIAEGLHRVGIKTRITDSRARLDEGFPILLGTTFWRGIERDGEEFLLVDRCSFGDTERFVSLVWNGHGRRGDHRVPEHFDGSRWRKYGMPLKPWRLEGSRIVLCGQTETYSPHHKSLESWYSSVPASHFRPHPAGSMYSDLRLARDWDDCILAVTLNSSIAVQSVMDGIPTVTMDEASMAWNVTSHHWSKIEMPDRYSWAERLAWCQWTDEELREGVPWEYLL